MSSQEQHHVSNSENISTQSADSVLNLSADTITTGSSSNTPVSAFLPLAVPEIMGTIIRFAHYQSAFRLRRMNSALYYQYWNDSTIKKRTPTFSVDYKQSESELIATLRFSPSFNHPVSVPPGISCLVFGPHFDSQLKNLEGIKEIRFYKCDYKGNSSEFRSDDIFQDVKRVKKFVNAPRRNVTMDDYEPDGFGTFKPTQKYLEFLRNRNAMRKYIDRLRVCRFNCAFNLPSTLEVLNMRVCEVFNHPFGSFPENLKEVYFGLEFIQDLNHLSDYVRVIVLECGRYNLPFTKLPTSLVRLLTNAVLDFRLDASAYPSDLFIKVLSHADRQKLLDIVPSHVKIIHWDSHLADYDDFHKLANEFDQMFRK
jgi:hypothetical protein